MVHKLKEINRAEEQRARQAIASSHKEAKHAGARSLRSASREWRRTGEKTSQAEQNKSIGEPAMRSASERASAHFADSIDMARPA